MKKKMCTRNLKSQISKYVKTSTNVLQVVHCIFDCFVKRKLTNKTFEVKKTLIV